MTAAVTDFTQFSTLRAGAERNDPAVLREVAGQFEALFIEMVFNNMREASLGDPLIGNSEQHEMYRGMLDQQLALEMSSGRGIGLADMLVRQLGGEQTVESTPVNLRLPEIPRAAEPHWRDPTSFTRDIWPHAEKVAQRLNVSTEAVVAQAALETGWGAFVPSHSDGSSSFNLFGIKAAQGWPGQRVAKHTIEFEDGLPRRQVAEFRAYQDVAATFEDYSELLTKNPRYAAVRDHGDDIEGFARALQTSGYATDPLYAAKLRDVAQGETMRRAVAALKSEADQPINQRQPADAI
ncbi:MAG: rod-binding protein [Woeseiaceae bacterium]|nr:rod-binding protein [Woeseiaceae bacterium]